MNDKAKNESLVEVAMRIMKAKKKPKTFKELTNEIFQIKGIKKANDELRAQFQLDFMLSGNFVCCGEDKNGLKLWDLKSRQPSTLLDKDGNYLEDLYEFDEDVVRNELKDDFVEPHEKVDDYLSDEEDEEEDDDIQEELGLIAEDSLQGTTDVAVEKDEEEEAEDEEEDDVEKALGK